MRTMQNMSLPPVTLQTIPVGKIKRHPTAQRAPQPKRWEAKVGPWDRNKIGVVVLCRNGNGEYYAIEGAHRVEKAQATEGPSFKIPALVYDGVLDEQQGATVFRALSTKLDISTGVGHTINIKARDADAIFIEEQRIRLPRCRTVGAFYTILKQHGRVVLKQTVDIGIRVWGQQADFPGSFLSGLARYVDEAKPSGSALTATIKRWKTGKRSPPQWLDRARLRRAQYGGNGSLSEHLRVLLRGSRVKNWQAGNPRKKSPPR